MSSRTLFVPGRIELFGKHVDYGGGPSLTCAISEGIRAEIETLEKPVLEVEDRTTGRRSRIPLRRGARAGGSHGGTYVAAVARRMSRDFAPLKAGVRVRTESTLPRSSGLSSSSAFVTLLVIAVAEANRLMERRHWRDHLSTPLALAEYCGAVEMGGPFGPFPGSSESGVGTRGGAQDHVAIVCNQADYVGAFNYLPAERAGRAHFPGHWSIVVGVSGVRATKTGGAMRDYNRASDQVRDLVAAWNRGTGRGDLSLASALRSSKDAPQRLEELARNDGDAPWHLARLEQFRAETERIVPQALIAFEAADGAALGRLAVESQQRAETALKNQVPETMFLARSAMACGAHAASAFGAGFGGAVWAICDTSAVPELMRRWPEQYGRAFPQRAAQAQWIPLRPGPGGRVAVKLARNVKVLAAVSFLTDVASEMIYPLLPLFLSGTLGVSASVLGAIEGAAESVSSLLRLPAGWISDKIGRRKPLVVFGYSLAAVARPLVGLAQSAGAVLAIRLTDRFGKGVRSSPRDALIADSVPPDQRGYAYGLHRAADNSGAVLGPLIAWAVLSIGLLELRALFLWAALPGLLAVILLVLFVREAPRRPHRGEVPMAEPTEEAVAVRVMDGADGAKAKARQSQDAPALGAPFWRYLGVLLLFTLSNSTDAFLLLRASQLGVPTALIPILWAMLHVVKSSSSVVGGALSDRIGRRPLIIAGWTVFALCYLGLSVATEQWHAWWIFLVYGLYFGMTEGTEKALVADFVPASRRGTAFGWFNATLGLGALPASVLFGIVWERAGAETAFLMGAGIALVAMIAFALTVAPRGTQTA